MNPTEARGGWSAGGHYFREGASLALCRAERSAKVARPEGLAIFMPTPFCGACKALAPHPLMGLDGPVGSAAIRRASLGHAPRIGRGRAR